MRCLLNSGQTCIALTRLLVPRESLSEAETIAAAVAEAHTLGDPFDADTKMGPLVSAAQRESVRELHPARASTRAPGWSTGGAEPPRA